MSPTTHTRAEAARLAVVERSGFVESRHLGSAVVLDPEGTVVLSLGDPDAPIFTRSSLKPLQAIAAMSLGADLTGPAAALATASHRSEAAHAEVVAGMLSFAGLSAADLRCPSVHPADGAFRRRLQEEARAAAAGAGPREAAVPGEATLPRETTSPLYFNCSGKHAAFLRAARAQGADTAGYLDPDHPVQRRVAEVVTAFSGEDPAAVGTDGCGAPVFALSLPGLARAVGRVVALGSGAAAPDAATPDASQIAPYAGHARTLIDAVFADPWAIEGHGRPNTTVIERLGVFAKGGAEGVIVMATRDGHAVALKCHDGSARATGLVALTLLERAGALPGITADHLGEVADLITEPVTGGIDSTGRTAVVGRIGLGEDVAEIRRKEIH